MLRASRELHRLPGIALEQAQQGGVDLSEVQCVLGHSRLSTTGIYTVPDDDLRDAVERTGI